MAFNSLSDLRKSRGGFDNLMKEVDKISQPAGGERKEDDRLWQPTVDKAGNGYAVIRFLPPPKGEELPWVRIWNHGFQGPTGKWYIENSLTTLGKPDPVSELNNELWNSGSEANKEIARALDIAETTVKIHVQHILRKLDLTSRVQAAVYAAGRLT